jgi:hypothetical protein
LKNLIIVIFLLFLSLFTGCGFFGNSTLWKKDLASKPTPDRFSFLMFPKKLMDEKGQETGILLERAIVATQHEILQKTVGVDFEDKSYKVSLDRLSPQANLETQNVLIENWKKERLKRGEKVDFVFTQLKDGQIQAVLTISDPKNIEIFTYKIGDGNLSAELWEMDRARHLAN